jgi:uncharacterized membrane protein
MKLLRDLNFLTSLAIILLTICLSAGVSFNWFQLRFLIGPLTFSHWLSWIGTIFIAFYTPLYYILKRRHPKRIKDLLKIHILGSLLAFMLVSMHFFQMRPRGTGEALFITVSILVVTGFISRFQMLKKIGKYNLIRPHINKFIHISVISTFYIVIIVHIFQHLGAP